MALPTFIIAGAPKCGTTALWAYLNEHPQICMAKIKEPRFFSEVENGVLETGEFSANHLRSGTYGKGREWYEKLFHSCAQRPARGEASTQYFTLEGTPRLIREMLPNIKLIFMLRDPVNRLYSHYWQEVKVGLKLPSFPELVTQNHPRFRYYQHVSQYRTHLENYRRVFSKERCLVLLHEDLLNSPLDILQKVYTFLDVDPTFTPNSLGEHFNQQTQPKNVQVQQVITYLRNHPWVQQLPDALRQPLGRIVSRLSKTNTTIATMPPLDEIQRAKLIPHFLADIEYVEQWITRDLSSWRK